MTAELLISVIAIAAITVIAAGLTLIYNFLGRSSWAKFKAENIFVAIGLVAIGSATILVLSILLLQERMPGANIFMN